MKKGIWMMLAVSMMAFMLGVTQPLTSVAAESNKKAILVVAFGTTFPETRKLTIDSVTEKIRAAFPEYEVRQAFTSRIVIKRIAENEGIHYDTEKQALEKLKAEGFQEVVVQPLHIEPGDEYDKVSRLVDSYKQQKVFEKITLGRSLLYYFGQEGKADDYKATLQALQTQFPKLKQDEAVLLMGHGGAHPANAAYGVLQMKINDLKMNNVFVFTVEGYPTFEDVVTTLKEHKIKKVTLMPLMVVAGDHANNDMAGADKDSYKSRLTAAGFKVDAYLHGLGENTGIQDSYVQHVKDAISGVYTVRGADKPVIPVVE